MHKFFEVLKFQQIFVKFYSMMFHSGTILKNNKKSQKISIFNFI